MSTLTFDDESPIKRLPLASAPLDDMGQLNQKLADLQSAMEVRAPGYVNILRTIHTDLAKQPDLVHMLTPEAVGLIVNAMAQHKNVVIVTAAVKSKKTGKSLKQLTADDV